MQAFKSILNGGFDRHFEYVARLTDYKYMVAFAEGVIGHGRRIYAGAVFDGDYIDFIFLRTSSSEMVLPFHSFIIGTSNMA